MVLSHAGFAADHYWIGGNNITTDFRSRLNWSLTLGGTAEGTTGNLSLSATENLVIDGSNLGGGVTGGTVTFVATGSFVVGRLWVINGASVVLVRASSNGSLTINGDGTATDDFIVDSTATYGASRFALRTPGGSYLGGMRMLLGTATAQATGTIAGTFAELDNTTTNFIGVYYTNALQFTAGSTCIVQNGATTYPFSAGSSASSFSADKSVVFQPGAHFYYLGGGSPFSAGAACANSCGNTDAIFPADFMAGSNIYIMASNLGANGRFTNGRTLPNVFISNGATLTADGNGTITGTLTVATGATFNLNDKNITLASTATATASVAAVKGTITYGTSGRFTVQRYIPGGKRAFRLLGHPLNATLDLTALTDDVLITGGDGTGGFTASASNNPSAFWYNPLTGNESTTNDAGWTAFTSTDGTGTGNTWDKYKGLRVLVRGSIADGLNAATPSPVVLDVSGEINTGNQVINLVAGSTSGFNFVGNPYPSNINLTTAGGNITIGSNVQNNYYVWDMSLGTKGGWDNRSFASSYILPSFAAFIVKTTAADNITLTENAKVATAPTGTLQRTATTPMVRLWVTGQGINWDKLEVYFTPQPKDKDRGVKMMNSEVNLYALYQDKQLSIDALPNGENTVLPLGFTTTLQQPFTFTVSDYTLPADQQLYLYDAYTATQTRLQKGSSYTFQQAAGGGGQNRFSLLVQYKKANAVMQAGWVLAPNPAKGSVRLTLAPAQQPAEATITGLDGKVLGRQVIASGTSAINIPVQQLPAGVYTVTLQSGATRQSRLLFIEN
jgi:hypothetical protein